MIRTTLDKVHIQRTVKVLYGWTQATPKSAFLDADWDRSVAIWPGMVMMKNGAQTYTLIDGTGVPAGLCALFIGGENIDEPADSGINALAVWEMAPDAEMEVLAPAFDTAQTWTLPTDGTEALVHASTAGANRGKLVPAGTAGASAVPVGRLLEVGSNRIVVGGLAPR